MNLLLVITNHLGICFEELRKTMRNHHGFRSATLLGNKRSVRTVYKLNFLYLFNILCLQIRAHVGFEFQLRPLAHTLLTCVVQTMKVHLMLYLEKTLYDMVTTSRLDWAPTTLRFSVRPASVDNIISSAHTPRVPQVTCPHITGQGCLLCSAVCLDTVTCPATRHRCCC
jgi:hypothetical protein